MSIHFVAIRSSAAENRSKTLRTRILEIQGHSKSSMSTPPKHVTGACYDKQHFYVKQANSGKITTF